MNHQHFLITIGLSTVFCLSGFAQVEDESTLRIGIYDNRAIAIAYAPSRHNPVGENMKRFQQAKKDGDEKKIRELEEWGQQHQRQLHRQGFAEVPVNDLLEHVKDGMAKLAAEKKLIAIVRHCDFVAEQVETVDVTEDLVGLFEPSEQTWKYVRSLKGKPAIDLDEIEKLNRKEEASPGKQNQSDKNR